MIGSVEAAASCRNGLRDAKRHDAAHGVRDGGSIR
jgi:hypothetical protein